MSTPIREAQRLVIEQMGQALERIQRERFDLLAAEGKRQIRNVRQLKYDFNTIVRMARAVEALESIEPRYE